MSTLDGCPRCTALLSEINLARANAVKFELEAHALRREIQALRQNQSVGTDRLDLEPTAAGRHTPAICRKGGT